MRHAAGGAKCSENADIVRFLLWVRCARAPAMKTGGGCRRPNLYSQWKTLGVSFHGAPGRKGPLKERGEWAEGC